MNDTATPAGTTETGLVDDDAPVPPGRPVRLVPTAPGFWRVVLGVVTAVLAPFFGILVGSGIGSHDPAGRMDPLYWGFLVGGIVGALGLVAAGSGAMTMYRNSRSRTAEQEP